MAGNILVNGALGQSITLGGLYNASRDTMTDQCLLENIPEEAIVSEANLEKKYERTQTDSFKEKLASLGVSTNQGASLLSGLCNPRGSGLYAAHTSISNSTPQASGICIVKTKKHSLAVTEDALGGSLNLDNLDAAADATHVVVGIQYGARAVISLRGKPSAVAAAPAPNSGSKSKQEELEQLLAHIGLAFTGGDTQGLITEETTAENAKLAATYDLKVNSDITVKGAKTVTFPGVCQFVEKFNDSVEASVEAAASGDAASAPCISFDLMPIGEFLTEINQQVPGTLTPYEAIDAKLLDKIIGIFETASVTKRAYNDHWVACKAHEDYVSPKYIVAVKKTATDTMYEKILKNEIADALSSTRSDNTLLDLQAAVESYTSGDAAPSRQKPDMKNYVEKFAFIDQAKAAGAHLFNASSIDTVDKLADAQNDNDKAAAAEAKRDLYVLYLTAESTSKPSWKDNKRQILELLGSKRCIVAIVDYDMGTLPSGSKVVLPSIQLRRSGKIILPDVVADSNELSDKCLIRCGSASAAPSIPELPVPLENRRPVLMRCPKSGCPNVESMWLCPKCKEQITFGYAKPKDKNDKTPNIPDDNLYCSCGAYDIEHAEFKCNNKTHHTEYTEYPGGRTKFRELLLTMNPFEQFNILILGETGAGKSTFINAFINYLLYENMQDALDAEDLTFAVPGYFRCDDPLVANKDISVSFGKASSKESLSMKGQSATQSTVSYVINMNGKLIRLMDTPGLGDTRGIDTDYKNVADIMQTLESVDSLSAILFLIKTNQDRLSPSFDFVLSELMSHLHKDTAQNILFGFTYGASSKFGIGGAKIPLVALLEKRKLPIQTLTSDQNAFVFDSEGFRFVAAWQQNRLEMPDKDSVANSWRRSAEQTKKLIRIVMGLKTHDVQQTLSLERNRRLVAGMSSNMVDLARAISKTRTDLTTNLAEIAVLRSKGLLNKANLTYPQTTLIQEKLPYPRTVCCEPGCTEIQKDPMTNMGTIIFVKSCHDYCSISTAESTYGVKELGQCICFKEAGSDCNECHHKFGSHCHITYRQKFETKTITDEKAVEEGKQLQTDEERVAGYVKKAEEKGAALDKEEAQIRTALARFSVYLAANSITAYNDGVLAHLDTLIGVAKDDPIKTQYEDYMAQKKSHEAKIKQIKEDIEKSKDNVPNEKEIEKLFADLGDMKEYGASFRGLLVKDAVVPTHTAIPIKVSKTGSWKKIGNWLRGWA